MNRKVRETGVISQVATSRVRAGAVSATTSLVSGRPIYYQHLLSARNARNALEGHADITPSVAKFALLCLDDHLRMIAAAIAS